MIDENIYKDLYRYCQNNLVKKIEMLFEEHKDDYVDVLHEEGSCFGPCFAQGYDQSLKLLIDYYSKWKLGGELESLEYKLAYYKLQQVLIGKSESYSISEEVKQIINPYIEGLDYDSDEDKEKSFDDLEEEGFTENSAHGGVSNDNSSHNHTEGSHSSDEDPIEHPLLGSDNSSE
jgi:hypothetical protein